MGEASRPFPRWRRIPRGYRRCRRRVPPSVKEGRMMQGRPTSSMASKPRPWRGCGSCAGARFFGGPLLLEGFEVAAIRLEACDFGRHRLPCPRPWRQTRWRASTSACRGRSFSSPRGTARGPRLVDGLALAPISSTPYFSSTPILLSDSAVIERRLAARWAAARQGRSFSMMRATTSA